MHTSTLQNWQHSHLFSLKNERGERRIRLVLILTLLTMTAEIIAGTVFGSMALLADGWHMGTHVAAFLIAVFAYRHAHKHQHRQISKFLGWHWLDLLMGMVGAAVITIWALGLLKEATPVLLDQVLTSQSSIPSKRQWSRTRTTGCRICTYGRLAQTTTRPLSPWSRIIPNRLSITKICCGNFTRSRMSRSR